MKSTQSPLFPLDLPPRYPGMADMLRTPPAQSSGAFGSPQQENANGSSVNRVVSGGPHAFDDAHHNGHQREVRKPFVVLAHSEAAGGVPTNQPFAGAAAKAPTPRSQRNERAAAVVPTSDAQRLSDQCKTVLAWLKAGGEVTPARAREIGCQRLAARIGEIKAMGYAITSRRDPVTKEAVYAMGVRP